MGYRDYSTAKGHIVDASGFGDFTTIQAAINAASSGQTVFIRPGTYNENPTLKAGVDLVAFVTDSDVPNVIINGTCSFTSAGTVGISGVMLQTNGNFALSVTGSAASIVYVNDCYINCINASGIQFTSSSGSSALQMNSCNGNLSTTGISYFSINGAGSVNVYDADFGNTGNSTTASTVGGSSFFGIFSSVMSNGITITGTANLNVQYSVINLANAPATCVTYSSTSVLGLVSYSALYSQTASAINITSGTLAVDLTEVNSSNTNAITGAGTIKFGLIVYRGSSSTNNVATQTQLTTQPTIIGGTITQHDALIGGASGAIASVAPSATSGVPFISQGASADPIFGTAVVAGGGTGDTSFTAYTPICGGTTTTGALQSVASIGTSGQVLTSNGAAALPSFKNGGWVFISTQTASNSATLNFTSIPVYDDYVLVFDNILIATNANKVEVQVSSNNGVSYANTGYTSGVNYLAYNSATVTNVNSTSAALITSNASNGSGIMGIAYFNSHNGLFRGYSTYLSTDNSVSSMAMIGGGTGVAMNAFQILSTSGNLTSGSVSLFGIPS